MLSIGWVVFWKCVIVCAWSEFQDARARGDFARLLARFQQEWDRRRAVMRRLRARGWTLSRIGARYGISRQRVWSILRTP